MVEKGVLPEFQEFLRSNKLAAEKHVLFIAIWASKFLSFSNRLSSGNDETTVAEFLNSLEGREGIKDWQIRQAAEAVRLYLEHFKRVWVPSSSQEDTATKGKHADREKLLAEMKRLIRVKHLAYNTETAYLDWAEKFFSFVREIAGDDPDSTLDPEHAQNFLSHLAISRCVSSSTQNQALCSLVFLFRNVLGREIGDISGMVWAKRGKKLPVVLWPDEVKALFKHLSGTSLLMKGVNIREIQSIGFLDAVRRGFFIKSPPALCQRGGI